MSPHASALKSSAPDPLAALFARSRIDSAQYEAGREFQRLFAIADRRRPEQPCGLADDQTKAWQALTACYRALGQDGSAVINDALIGGMTTRQIAEARGKTGLQWKRYYVRRLRECLHTLSDVFGFASASKSDTNSVSKPTYQLMHVHCTYLIGSYPLISANRTHIWDHLARKAHRVVRADEDYHDNPDLPEHSPLDRFGYMCTD